MLQVVILEGESLYEAWHLVLVVSANCLLLLFDSLSNLCIKVFFLEINQLLKMLEHTIHLLRQLL